MRIKRFLHQGKMALHKRLRIGRRKNFIGKIHQRYAKRLPKRFAAAQIGKGRAVLHRIGERILFRIGRFKGTGIYVKKHPPPSAVRICLSSVVSRRLTHSPESLVGAGPVNVAGNIDFRCIIIQIALQVDHIAQRLIIFRNGKISIVQIIRHTDAQRPVLVAL